MRINGKIDDKIVVSIVVLRGHFEEWKDGYYEKKRT